MVGLAAICRAPLSLVDGRGGWVLLESSHEPGRLPVAWVVVRAGQVVALLAGPLSYNARRSVHGKRFRNNRARM